MSAGSSPRLWSPSIGGPSPSKGSDGFQTPGSSSSSGGGGGGTSGKGGGGGGGGAVRSISAGSRSPLTGKITENEILSQRRRRSHTTGEEGEEDSSSKKMNVTDELNQSSSPLANTSDPNSVGDQSPTPMSELAIPTRVVTVRVLCCFFEIF